MFKDIILKLLVETKLSDLTQTIKTLTSILKKVLFCRMKFLSKQNL